MTIAIIIVSYNGCATLRQCLASLASVPGVTVVDNASTDASAEMVQREFPQVHLIANAENRGFAAACNQALRAQPAEFVLLLNPDTVITQTAIERLLEIMRTHPRVGACGPRLVHPDGSLQRSCRRFPSLGTMAKAELGWRGRYRMHDFAHDQTRPVDQLMGACLLVRTAAISRNRTELTTDCTDTTDLAHERQQHPCDPCHPWLPSETLFDERFFLYSEEVDLCWRLKHAGWEVLFVHDAVVTHVGGESSKTAQVFSLRHRYRSLFEFYRKHFPRWQLGVLKLAVQVGTLGRCLLGQQPYGVIAREVWRL